jgi:hypothetical protein
VLDVAGAAGGRCGDRHAGPQVVRDRREVVGHHVEVSTLPAPGLYAVRAPAPSFMVTVEAGLAQRLPVHPGDDLLLGRQAGADGDLGLRLAAGGCSSPVQPATSSTASATSNADRTALDHPLRGRARIPSRPGARPATAVAG